MEAEKDRTKIDPAPESTWGASEDVKAKWHAKHGKAAEKAAERDEKD